MVKGLWNLRMVERVFDYLLNKFPSPFIFMRRNAILR